MQTSDRRLIISGDRVEFSHFQHFYDYGKREKTLVKKISCDRSPSIRELYETDEQTYQRRLKFQLSNRIRSQTSLVRLVNANKVYDRGRHSFLTLTYKEEQRDITTAQRDFAKFIQRLNYAPTIRKSTKRIRYVSVIEFQDKKRNGVIHFHVILFDVPYIHWHTLTQLWGHGSIDINARDKSGKPLTVTRVAKYMAKYMAKGFTDTRLNGKKKYSASTNLNRPTVIREPAHVDSVVSLLALNNPAHQSRYHSQFLGDCNYFVYEGVSMDEIAEVLAQPPPIPRYMYDDFTEA